MLSSLVCPTLICSTLIVFIVIMTIFYLIQSESSTVVQDGGNSSLRAANLIASTSPIHGRKHYGHLPHYSKPNYYPGVMPWYNPWYWLGGQGYGIGPTGLGGFTVHTVPGYGSGLMGPGYGYRGDSCHDYAVNKCYDAIFPGRCYTNYYDRCSLGL